MALHLGIDLSAARCRIVDLDGQVSFTSIAMDQPEARAALESFRRRRAAVVVWGARSDHREVIVKPGPYDRMRAEARARLQDAAVPGFPLRGTLSDIAPAAPRPTPGAVESPAASDRQAPSTSSGQAPSTSSGQAVLLASASSAEVGAALAPLLAAGVNVHSVLTPAAALQALARTERRPSANGLEAYVALTETATCIAVLLDGALVAARDLRWGYLDEAAEFEIRPRDDIARRLAEEISSFVDAHRVGGSPPLVQVSVCGGLQDLRSMTMALMERIDVEVEALDSLQGIDAATLPEPADQFRERIAELQLAWAAAAVARPALDLYRDRRRRVVGMHLSRAAMMSGAVVGLGIGWSLQGQWRPAEYPPPRVARAAAAALPASAPPAPKTSSPSAPITSMSTAFKMPVPAPPPLPVSVAAAVTAPTRPASRRPIAAPKATPAVSTPSSVIPGIPGMTADVGTILFGPDRQLAIVDGRIVQVGDDVSGARVIEITSAAVVLRDAQGRTKRLAVGAPGS